MKKLNNLCNSSQHEKFENKKRELITKQVCKKHQRTDLNLQTSDTTDEEKQKLANKSDTTLEQHKNFFPEVWTEKRQQTAVDMPLNKSEWHRRIFGKVLLLVFST